MPHTNVLGSINNMKGRNQGLSFKEWKIKQVGFSQVLSHHVFSYINFNLQEQDTLGKATHYSVGSSLGNNDILSGSKKQVRFNSVGQTQSLPIIQENAVLPTVIHSTESLPPNLIQNPVERRMELSICEAVLKQQQLDEQQRKLQESQRNMMPVFAGLYQQADAMHLLQQSSRQEIAPVTSSTFPCTCQHHLSPQTNTSPQMVFQPPPTISTEASRVQEMRTEVLEKRVESLQEQLYLLQQQMSYILSMQSTSPNVSPVQQTRSSNPFLSHIIEDEKKPQMIDSSTQYTIIIEPTKTETKPHSDKTFFNQVLGQVNQLLDNTDESNNNHHIDSRACKFIDSDTSAVSIFDRDDSKSRDAPIKKSTDKSTVMDSLAAKYLTSPHTANNTQDSSYRTNKTGQEAIDVSTTCYNYLKKYDLLKNYGDDDSNGNVQEKLLKSRQIKLL